MSDLVAFYIDLEDFLVNSEATCTVEQPKVDVLEIN